MMIFVFSTAAGHNLACSDDHEFRPSAVDLDTDSDMDMDADSDGDGDGDQDTNPDSNSNSATDSATDSTVPSSDTEPVTVSRCLENTEDISQCEDCCDCAISDCKLRAACRSECETASFNNNDAFIVFDVPSDRGTDGDYQSCFIRGDRQACIDCCDCATIYSCGDYKYCRQVCADIV